MTPRQKENNMYIASDLVAAIKKVWAGAKSRLQSVCENLFDASSAKKALFDPKHGSQQVRDDSFPNRSDENPRKTRVARIPNNLCVYAIGDIHGRFDLLMDLLQKIQSDIENLPPSVEVKLIFLGDYIDRGFNSKQIVDYFISGALDQYETVYLMGNHESALLQFTEDASFGETWASYGGVETLYSYGFQVPTRNPAGNTPDGLSYQDQWSSLWKKFRSELPESHLSFYRQLDPFHIVGDYIFVHAGLKPGVPIEQQSANDLFWIRDEFLSDRRQFEKVVVHGHTPADTTYRDNRRIGLDTGAYITGRLSAGRFFGAEVQFIST